MSVDVVTFGCRLNAVESELMRRHALAAGLKDAVIVNSCAVTAEAERQVRQTVRRLRRERPAATIVVAGCAVQLAPDRYGAMPEVDGVLGTREKLDPAHYRRIGEECRERRSAAAPPATRLAVGAVGDVMEPQGALAAHSGPAPDAFAGRARAFVEIQQGCDHRCTFCIIPFARGPSASVPAAAVVERVNALVANGYREVVLTGVDIASWGRDLGDGGLGQLVRDLLAAVPDLPRLRLSTVDPAAIDADLVRAFAEEERLMPHLHLSLQAGDDLVLKRMRRRHTRADAEAAATAVRRVRPEVALGADVIAGFPTEDEAMAANTLAAVEALGLVYLHVFPYSARAGTPAARMPQVPVALRRERAARLRGAGARALERHLAGWAGRTEIVLAESPERGRSATYAPVRFQAAAPAGTLVETRILAAAADHLIGAPAA